MSADVDPVVGNWYQHTDKGEKFEVVSVDEDSGLVEIQYFDGNVEELDLDTWYDQDIEPIESPEDWTGPLDDIEHDDLGYTETDMKKEDWSSSLEEWPPEPEREEGIEREEGGPEEPWEEK